MPIEHINKTDTLNEGREKLNAAIDGANAADVTSKAADTKATQALANSESTQTQLDTIVIDGDSSVEAAQARVDEKGDPHPTLKARIDDGMNSVNQQLAETTHQRQEKISRSMSYLGMGKKSKSPKFAIISDDFRVEDYTKLFDLMKEKNVKIGHGIITSAVGTGNYGTWEQLKEMHEYGLSEVLGHSHEHRHSTQLDSEVLDEDIKTNLRVLREQRYDPDGFVYPYNAHNEQTANIVTKYFPYSFSKSGFNGQGRNFPTINNYAIARVALGSYFDSPESQYPQDTTSLEYQIARVDESIANNNFHVLVIHTWHEDMDAEQWQILRDTIDYIRSKGYDIEFPSEGFDAHGNLVQAAYYSRTNIDAEGKITSESIQYEVDTLKITKDLRINQMNNRKVYVNTISSSKASEEDWPEKSAGVVTTYRLSSVFNYNYQEYFVSSTGNLYRRKPDSSWNWSSFDLVSQVGTSYYSKRIDFSVDPNEYQVIEITDIPSIGTHNMITTTLVSYQVFQGLVYQTSVGAGGNVYLTLFNPTDSTIEYDGARFRFKVTKTNDNDFIVVN